MDITYKAPKGHRTNRNFRTVTTVNGMWWVYDLKRWFSAEDKPNGLRFSNHAPCKTTKSFIRMLRKNPEIVGSAILCHRCYLKIDGENYSLDVRG